MLLKLMMEEEQRGSMRGDLYKVDVPSFENVASPVVSCPTAVGSSR